MSLFFGWLAQLVQSISFTPRRSGVRIPHHPLTNKLKWQNNKYLFTKARALSAKVFTLKQSKARTKVQKITQSPMQDKDAKQKQFEELLKDFYVWKVWSNDPTWKKRFFKDKESALKEIKRSSMSK